MAKGRRACYAAVAFDRHEVDDEEAGIPPWYLKAAAQDVLCVLPGTQRLNGFFQQHVTHSLGLSEAFFARKAGQAARHADAYRRLARAPRHGFSGLELGTGWHPVVPVGLFLCGADRVVSIDVRPVLDVERCRGTLAAYVRSAQSGELAGLLPLHDPERLGVLREALAAPAASADALLGRVGISIVAGDARTTGLPDASVDLIVSNNTLEHIPADVLAGIFREFRRLAPEGGLMSNSIDLSDHYAHFDRRLTPYNFLKYSDAAWRWANNGLGYQNRWRLSDYRRLHQEAGFELVEETALAPAAERLREVRVADRFRDYTTADLAVTSAWLAARPVP